MRWSLVLLSAGLALLSLAPASAQNNRPRNLILFVPDGLRAMKVSPETAPAMAALRDQGVNFRNPHSLFPTFTMPNGSALATGHYLGDTGVFSNTTGYSSAPAGGMVVPFIENDSVLGDIDERFSGNSDHPQTGARQGHQHRGHRQAGVPLSIRSHNDQADQAGLHSIVIDDATGNSNGVPLSDEIRAALTRAGLPLAAPSRADNGKAGDASTNIIVSADHGLSTISKESATSPSARVDYADTRHGFLPMGFPAMDLSAAV